MVISLNLRNFTAQVYIGYLREVCMESVGTCLDMEVEL